MMTNVYRAQAQAAMEARSALVAEARKINEDPTVSESEKRSAITRLNADIDRLAGEARSAVERGEREAEVRRLAGGSALFNPGSAPVEPNEWRSGLIPSLSEYRAAMAEGSPSTGGWAVPENVAGNAIEMLRAKSVFLGSPGLNVVPFTGGSFVLPGFYSFSAAGVTAEGAPIPEGSQDLRGLVLQPVKYSDYRVASTEILEDSNVDIRVLLNNEMVRNVAQAVDKDAFAAGNGTTALKGLTAAGQSTVTPLGTGVNVAWDDVITAWIEVVAAGGTPTVIWASPDQYGPLLRQKASGSGEYVLDGLTNDPAKAALGLPLRVSGNLPAKTVIVADATRIYVGLRQDVRVAVSMDAAFQNDQTAFRCTYRIAGVNVADASAVQVVQAG